MRTRCIGELYLCLLVGGQFTMTNRKFAFGHDDLEPVSKSFNDGRNGWGATIIDAMSTMSIMGLDVSDVSESS